QHFEFMEEALKLSEKALEFNEVPVGCVFVLDGKEIIGRGMNATNESLCGIRHAEFVAIDEILQKYSNIYQTNDEIIENVFSNCELYVTVEPCIMCASALRQLKIKRVIFGCGNDRFGGNGTVVSCNKGFPKNHNSNNYPKEYSSYPGILNKKAVLMLRKFYLQENDKAPDPQVKKNRININTNEFPKIDYQKYLDLEDFLSFYGEERIDFFNDQVD
ncbi:hypothetical protein PACTADRAFT_25085, partial [Pachysolen tannophilus NRRL Y-2460]